MTKLKTVEIYWINNLNNKVAFYNDTLDEENYMGDVAAQSPIKLSLDIHPDAIPVIQQMSQDKILVSSINMSAVVEDDAEEVVNG